MFCKSYRDGTYISFYGVAQQLHVYHTADIRIIFKDRNKHDLYL